MKKLFAIVALVAAMSFAGNAQAQIIAYLGYAPETFKLTDSYNSTYSYGYYFQGFNMGGAYNFELPFVSGLGVTPGLQFRMNIRGHDACTDTQILIDVPILANYAIPVTKDITVAPFVGPMLSIALSGKTKGNSTDYSLNWYGEHGDYNRFNLYGVIGVAGSYTNFMLYAGYRFGLLDIHKAPGFKIKTNGFFLGVGYSF